MLAFVSAVVTFETIELTVDCCAFRVSNISLDFCLAPVKFVFIVPFANVINDERFLILFVILVISSNISFALAPTELAKTFIVVVSVSNDGENDSPFSDISVRDANAPADVLLTAPAGIIVPLILLLNAFKLASIMIALLE